MKLHTVTAISCLFLVYTAAGQDVVTSSSRNGSTKTSYKNFNVLSNFNVESRGKIELSDDDKDIKSMSPDGYLEIKKTVFVSRRSLVITPSGSGLKREYYEGGTSVAFEPETKLEKLKALVVETKTRTYKGRFMVKVV